MLRPDLEGFGNGRPASTPPIAAMWDSWDAVVAASEPFLEALTPERLGVPLEHDERDPKPSVGTTIQRVIYHYWAHGGESSAIRQLLGHGDFPQGLGPAKLQPPYREFMG